MQKVQKKLFLNDPEARAKTQTPTILAGEFFIKSGQFSKEVAALFFLLVLDELLRNLQGPVENGRGGRKNNQLCQKYYIFVSTFVCLNYVLSGIVL